jgi:surface antigen
MLNAAWLIMHVRRGSPCRYWAWVDSEVVIMRQLKGWEPLRIPSANRISTWSGGRIPRPFRVAAPLAAAVIASGLAIGVAHPADAAAGGSSLSAGQELQAGQELVSAGGQYTLAMQTDGNLVTYGNGCVIWASNTAGTGSHDYLAMQGDGNLVIYTSGGKPVWASNTAGTGSANYLAMQGDGNLVVYTSGGKPVWASGNSNADQLCEPATMSAGKYLHSPSGQYTLNMQGDGNLVVYDQGSPIWASNTAGTGNANYVAMQGDGNLVVYTSGGTPVWASNTAGSGGKNTLVMQNDGNLVIYTSGGNAVWASKSAGSGTSSGTGGYPYANAVCEFGSAGGAHCTNPNDDQDMYDWGYWSGSTFRPFDQWGYEYRNCTSYVAWRLSTAGVNTSLFKDLGNADTWITRVSGKAGVTVNRTASPGAVAVWDTPGVGHVAWVVSVNGGTVTVDDYNYGETGVFEQHTISSAPTDYIHF